MASEALQAIFPRERRVMCQELIDSRCAAK